MPQHQKLVLEDAVNDPDNRNGSSSNTKDGSAGQSEKDEEHTGFVQWKRDTSES